LRSQTRVEEACQACRMFGWTDAIPILEDILARPTRIAYAIDAFSTLPAALTGLADSRGVGCGA